MAKPGTGLGRGLSALLDEAVRPATASADGESPASGVREVEVSRIHPNPNQPRTQFDEEAIAELAESIAERGILQPILVRPHGAEFQIVAGERRWRAAQKAQLHRVPVLVREIDDSTAAEIALVENIQRKDLNPLEEAEGYRQLIERYGHTQDAVAKLVHKSRSHVANLLRLLDLPDAVRDPLLRGDITMGHARAIAAADDAERLVSEIISKGLSVRQAEALAKKVRPGAGADIARASARNAQPADADLAALERQLADILGLRVKVAHNGAGGSVSLHYSSLDQLDMICQRLSGEPI
ncbi:ParB/RepB/Spo0J family partition protein [Sphingomonas sinipercae]|uniref:ParB/RepB/Spo0J family partition protein n=1 Tax=Sphingomonas sinipercae TaxID=2714944 RepID=A0A6G7ZKV6_9SPHN|nr:ParB/RepB/Spo0J family partition protein [Sphingomonas sinipercae]QIL01562.1 ParB/RepB/Spo0J family partition protein [Sphingomonas sinipercae]